MILRTNIMTTLPYFVFSVNLYIKVTAFNQISQKKEDKLFIYTTTLT